MNHTPKTPSETSAAPLPMGPDLLEAAKALLERVQRQATYPPGYEWGEVTDLRDAIAAEESRRANAPAPAEGA